MICRMRRGSYASNDGNSGRGNGTGAQPAKVRIHPHQLKLRLAIGYPAIDIYPAVRDGLPRQRFAASTRPYLSEMQ